MDKVIRDGKVAVLVSPGYGAGWSTWETKLSQDILLFSPLIVEMVEAGRQKEITEGWINEKFGVEDVYPGGAYQLEIEWVEVGTKFTIREYDGSEWLEELDIESWQTA